MNQPVYVMSTPQPVIGGVDVEAVAVAVNACAGVSGLDGGRFGEIVSYLPGRRVPGVVVRDWSVLVGVRSRWGVRVADLFAQVAAAAAPLIGRRWVEMTVCDIDDPPAPGHVPPPRRVSPEEFTSTAVKSGVTASGSAGPHQPGTART